MFRLVLAPTKGTTMVHTRRNIMSDQFSKESLYYLGEDTTRKLARLRDIQPISPSLYGIRLEAVKTLFWRGYFYYDRGGFFRSRTHFPVHKIDQNAFRLLIATAIELVEESDETQLPLEAILREANPWVSTA